MITIEEFKRLKREDMFSKLMSYAPDLMKGKTRAKKEELVNIYETLLKQVETSNEVINEVIAEESALVPPVLPLEDDDLHAEVANEMFRGVTAEGPNLSKTQYDLMIEAYEAAAGRKEDPYVAAAAVMFGVEVSAVTPKQREAAKGPLFAYIYGSDFSKMKGELEKDELAGQMAYPKSGDQAMLGLGLAMQNIPLRTEEAKQIRDALAEKTPDLGIDYASLEQRVASEHGFSPEDMTVGGIAKASMDSFDREKPYGSSLPAGTAILDGGTRVSTGIEGSMVTDEAVGVVVSRRAVVVRAVQKLSRDQLMVLAHYKALPRNGNRRQRKIAESLLRQIRRFLPKGITLDEAVAVLS